MSKKTIWCALLLLIVTIPAIAGPGHGGEEATINVSGSAVSAEAPDRVAVTFGVESVEPTSSAALAANSELMAGVIDALGDLGLEDSQISTSHFNIHAQYENRHNRETGENTAVLTGYRVSNILRVESADLEIVAPVIDAAVVAGVNRVDSVNFFLSPPVLSGLHDALIEAAVRDAKARAIKALAPLGQRITGVRQVNLSDFAGSVPRQLDFQRMEVASSAPTQVFASEQQIRTSVNVTFTIGPDPDAE